MKSMAISTFKAHALQMIDTVATEHESIIITRHGKPLAKVIPFKSSEKNSTPGKLAETLLFEKDIITPLPESEWEAIR
jgi:prevent-host-death family protein